eukprot:CAMPEP_0180490778 /NCGR_PEP_ID=MMETSP1036_2-20121128/39301_1 /TAXON_ID=632150 /ORGANISM="Azadinium spinosum, Strain 3D9" /LENGTH=419 /DNA_ID=CAMNT_0022499003 /DNA_START=238 /DNA_END=1497 /DNA_ORIENTATION=-
MIVRLFSMLHACALGEIEDSGDSLSFQEIEAFNMEVIDAFSLDDTTLKSLRDCDAKVQLTLIWIQNLIVDNISNDVLSIPPPILTRAFQELATGMVHYHDAMKISNVPFPFPYAQTCDGILLMHWLMTPFIVSQWMTNPIWAGIFGFLNVFTFWTLNLIAVELENPFGTDPNDIDAHVMQIVMNHHLRLLLSESACRGPTFRQGKMHNQGSLLQSITSPTDEEILTLNEIWHTMEAPKEGGKRSSCSAKSSRSRGSQDVAPARVTRVFNVNNIRKSICPVGKESVRPLERHERAGWGRLTRIRGRATTSRSSAESRPSGGQRETIDTSASMASQSSSGQLDEEVLRHRLQQIFDTITTESSEFSPQAPDDVRFFASEALRSSTEAQMPYGSVAPKLSQRPEARESHRTVRIADHAENPS